MPVPVQVSHLFRDCDIEIIDPHKHAPFVLSRTMCRSDESVVSWLRLTYTDDALRSYLFTDGARKLGPRDLAYWCGKLGVEELLRDHWVAAAEVRVRTDGRSLAEQRPFV